MNITYAFRFHLLLSFSSSTVIERVTKNKVYVDSFLAFDDEPHQLASYTL
jgi:hypothetical protein